eukprot:1161096-Pelagomonas_calceolata.AAC.9
MEEPLWHAWHSSGKKKDNKTAITNENVDPSKSLDVGYTPKGKAMRGAPSLLPYTNTRHTLQELSGYVWSVLMSMKEPVISGLRKAGRSGQAWRSWLAAFHRHRPHTA